MASWRTMWLVSPCKLGENRYSLTLLERYLAYSNTPVSVRPPILTCYGTGWREVPGHLANEMTTVKRQKGYRCVVGSAKQQPASFKKGLG
jgi:hypothetical protein